MVTILRAVIDATGLSRRKAFVAIREGYVTLDGETVTDPSRDYATGVLALEGETLTESRSPRTYLLLHKPPGFVTPREDDQGRATVMDLIPPDLAAPGLHPVGRLDRDTSGLLLLTDDGDLTYRLTHPRHEIEKEYWVRLARPPSEALLAAVAAGIEIDGRVRRPVALDLLPPDSPFDVSIVITEGRKRQVRRMFEAVGARVRYLHRVREGLLELGNLREGRTRRLTRAEIEALRSD